MSARRLHWADYRTTEYADIDPEKTIAILPTAAIEQHGPHLPLGVDTMINEGMLARLCELVPDDLDIRILPVQAVGKSNEHLHAPGTLTLPAEVAIRAWVEIGLSVARAGVQKDRDRELPRRQPGHDRDRGEGIAGRRRECWRSSANGGRSGIQTAMYSGDEMAFGIHGGDVETSLMLHFPP